MSDVDDQFPDAAPEEFVDTAETESGTEEAAFTVLSAFVTAAKPFVAIRVNGKNYGDFILTRFHGETAILTVTVIDMTTGLRVDLTGFTLMVMAKATLLVTNAGAVFSKYLDPDGPDSDVTLLGQSSPLTKGQFIVAINPADYSSLSHDQDHSLFVDVVVTAPNDDRFVVASGTFYVKRAVNRLG